MSHFLELASHRMHYCVDGPSDAPAIVFCNSLGTDLAMWDPQVAALADEYRIVRYDRRGHGQSSTSETGFSIADLAQDVIALIDHLNLSRVHFCGLSIGGLVGQHLGIHASNRLYSLSLCATASKIGDYDSWTQRAALIRKEGMAPLLEATAGRWFNDSFIEQQAETVKQILDTFAKTLPEGYAQCCEALAQADFSDDIRRITVPTLCIAGEQDPVCTPDDLKRLAQGVQAGSQLSIHGKHICNMESPDAFNQAFRSFLALHTPSA